MHKKNPESTEEEQKWSYIIKEKIMLRKNKKKSRIYSAKLRKTQNKKTPSSDREADSAVATTSTFTHRCVDSEVGRSGDQTPCEDSMQRAGREIGLHARTPHRGLEVLHRCMALWTQTWLELGEGRITETGGGVKPAENSEIQWWWGADIRWEGEGRKSRGRGWGRLSELKRIVSLRKKTDGVSPWENSEKQWVNQWQLGGIFSYGWF